MNKDDYTRAIERNNYAWAIVAGAIAVISFALGIYIGLIY
jgi:hypothetical protein